VAEIVAHQMRDQLHEGLAIVQDFVFQRVRQDHVGDHQHEDRGEPAREQDRDDDVVTGEPVAVPPLQVGEEWNRLDPGHRRKSSALSKVAARPEILDGRPASPQRQ
jgi:hypothetical protein